MKKFLCSIFTVNLALSLFAFEWGGKFNNNTAFKGNKFDNLKLKQVDSLSLWTNIPLSEDGNTYIAAEALYQFEADKTEKASKDYKSVFDFTLLKFNKFEKLSTGKTYLLSAGRFGISDGTGKIFNQVCDGVNFVYSTTKINYNAYLGFTGLLNEKNVSILNAPDTSFEAKDNDFYALAAKYIPLGVNVSFPSLFLNQNLFCEGWAFVDLNGDDFNRLYATAGLNGYLASNISYNFSTTLGTENFEGASNLTLAALNYYPMKTLGVTVNGTYASGENGSLSSFTGFSSQKVCLSYFEPEYSSVVKMGFGVSKIIKNIVNVSVSGAGVFSCPEDKLEYDGFEAAANAFWNVFEDVQVGLSFGEYFGDKSEADNVSIGLNLTFVF